MTVPRSPGAALSGRARLEQALTARTVRLIRVFLLSVEKGAAAEYASPVVMGTPLVPLTLGAVLDEWDVFVDAFIEEITRDGLTAAGWSDANLAVITGDVSRAKFLTGMRDRLRKSELPSGSFTAAKKIITRGRADGWSQRKMIAHLTTALDKDRPSDAGLSWDAQARRIARTEATALYNFTSLNQLVKDGATGKRWVAHHDKRTRPTHRAADGQTKPLSEPFLVGGWAGMIPGDPDLPTAETASCRCTTVGVYDDIQNMPLSGEPSDIASKISRSYAQEPSGGELAARVARRDLAAEGRTQARFADIVGKWTGGVSDLTVLRAQMGRGEWDDVLAVFKAAPSKHPTLYRSFAPHRPELHEVDALQAGSTIDLGGLASFTSDDFHAMMFTKFAQTKVVLVAESGPALPVAGIANTPWENEWLATGKFRVTEVVSRVETPSVVSMFLTDVTVTLKGVIEP